MRVAAIDCGTNSIRLLIADVDLEPGGAARLHDVERTMEVVRLGHGVDATGRIDPAAMERTLEATRRYAQSIRDLDAHRVRFVATSASRDAQNAADFVDGVRAAFTEVAGLDVTPEVVSGDEEARLSFAGATGDLVAAGIAGPYLVVDLGGGSTELVRGDADPADPSGARVDAARSVDIGCVRMTERHLHSDPATTAEVAAATRDIDAALDVADRDVDLGRAAVLVGVAGTVTTVTAQALGLPAYDPAVLHLTRLHPPQVLRACEQLLAADRASRARLGFMHPGRVDVIGAGSLVWSRIVARVATQSGLGDALPVITSEHDILDGIALSLARLG